MDEEKNGPSKIGHYTSYTTENEEKSTGRKRMKRGRPFVTCLEERIGSKTDHRGGIFRVQKKTSNPDSGIESPSSDQSPQQETMPSVAETAALAIQADLGPLAKSVENEEAHDRITMEIEGISFTILHIFIHSQF